MITPGMIAGGQAVAASFARQYMSPPTSDQGHQEKAGHGSFMRTPGQTSEMGAMSTGGAAGGEAAGLGEAALLL